VIEGKIDGRLKVTEKPERRRKQLLDIFEEAEGYCKLKTRTLDRPL
jgi:hypothetical protein